MLGHEAHSDDSYRTRPQFTDMGGCAMGIDRAYGTPPALARGAAALVRCTQSRMPRQSRAARAGTQYEIRVGGNELRAHTWSERFAVAKTITVGNHAAS